MRRALASMAVMAALAGGAGCGKDSETDEPATHATGQTVKVAVIGALMDTGFWQAISDRFEKATGNKVQVVVSGPRGKCLRQFRKGGIDLLTVQSSDGVMNLVADGLAKDPQPWLRYDLVWVGPTSDPAGIKGDVDASDALKKIIEAKQPILIHTSYGADAILNELRDEAGMTFDPGTTSVYHEDKQNLVMQRASQLQAYTLMGRVPLVDGKLKSVGITVLAQGDPKLRRPFVVEIATNANPAAADLEAFMRSQATQEWIAQYGKGKFDSEPFFYPVKPAVN